MGRRHCYDLTNDTWITPPSGMTPDAGGAAELRQCLKHDRIEHSKPLGADPLAHSSLRSPGAGSTWALRLFDVLLMSLAVCAMMALLAVALA